MRTCETENRNGRLRGVESRMRRGDQGPHRWSPSVPTQEANRLLAKSSKLAGALPPAHACFQPWPTVLTCPSQEAKHSCLSLTLGSPRLGQGTMVKTLFIMGLPFHQDMAWGQTLGQKMLRWQVLSDRQTPYLNDKGGCWVCACPHGGTEQVSGTGPQDGAIRRWGRRAELRAGRLGTHLGRTFHR